MKNLELHLLPIEDVDRLNRQFDLIVSTGVLHHLADPQKGLQALAGCLRPQGVVALMLYAKYGRIGVEILQSVARDLGLEQNEESLVIVKNMLAILPQNHPIQSYISIAPDLQYDAGLVDTFLHGRDLTYTVKDCIELVTSAGLVFQDMFMKSPYYPPADITNVFYSSVSNQTEQKQWSIMERIQIENGCHFFTACHKKRPQKSYVIDFADATFLDYRPQLRFRCALHGDTLSRHNWSMQLRPIEIALIQRIDGERTIRKIISDISHSNLLVNMKSVELERIAKNLFQRLWRLDFLVMGLATSS
jgi:hypothetical protein